MPIFTAGSIKLDADLFVFDKDGLMFDSEQFWIEMINARCRELLSMISPDETLRWASLMGADTVLTADGEPRTTFVDPLGVCAVASPLEESTITAGYLVALRGCPWHEARAAAVSFLERSNLILDLKKALKPQPGFIGLMRRLAELKLPYGIATSDNFERTRDSMVLYGFWEDVRFVVTPEEVKNGKPAPDMLLYISEKTGVPPERIAMVGDSYVDVKMASNAGSIGIGVSTDPEMRKKMKPYASAVLDSLAEIVI